ncbi:MAG: endo alpha-1,4 polygalactosaminidase [bacterium]|nr:endo alpha-1,4 polygalactosaminidase [bacterium]
MQKNKLFLIILGILIILVIGYFVVSNYLSEDEDDNITNQTSNSIAPEDIDWWVPSPEASWQWQLSGTINTEYDVDIYDVDLVNTPQKTIDELQTKGVKVICYFSAGSWENFRSDANEFPDEVLGNKLEGWADEKWLDVSNYQQFSSIMEARLDLAVEKKCDGVESDNVDGYQNNNGFSLTASDQLVYNRWLATEAHDRGLSIGLKNDLDQIEDLVGVFDFAVNEQCFEYDECEELLPFTNQGKAVLGVEYELETDEFCEEANSMNFSWLKMDYDLDGDRIACR